MTVFSFFDRFMIRAFTARTGRSVQAHTPLYIHMRTIISQRSINCPAFTVGGQLVTLVFHGSRLAHHWIAEQPGATAS